MIRHTKIINSYKIYLILSMAFFVVLFLPHRATGQIRAGVGYLKMLSGAREAGVFGTLSGALDYTYSFYANPGATGFLREWQWSVTYTNWISDVYNASFLYGRKIRTPLSRWSRFVIGVNYLGIPEFNNTSQTSDLVSGNNLLIAAGIGQPLTFITDNLSIGANLKYYKSKLAQFEADAMIYDVGLLYRTPRYNIGILGLGLFDYIIFSTGLSLNNQGSPMTFISEETPLPKTFRAGASINIGIHHGMQISLGTDYREFRDEKGFYTFGSEISWRQIVSLRMGYSWENNLLGHFIFGGGIRLDDQIINNKIFGRNNALRLDLATNQTNDFFASPYHGTITHHPLGPERFRLLEPTYGQIINADSVNLRWELTRDPDLYDEVQYLLVVDKDSSKLAQAVEIIELNQDKLLLFLTDTLLFISQPIAESELSINELEAGDYFWAVIAYDKDNHFRCAEMDGKPITKFHVTVPIPQVINIDFKFSPWITEDDTQGVLRLDITNIGDRVVENFMFSIYDSTKVHRNGQYPPDSIMTIKRLLGKQAIPEIQPGDTITIELDWLTERHGLHEISTEISRINQRKKIFHRYSEDFYTIPKGIFTTRETVIVQKQFYITYDLPYVGKIFFDSNSAVVKEKYVSNWFIEQPLALFTKRLNANPEITISLQGTINPESDSGDGNLAFQRAMAVKASFSKLGVDASRIKIKPVKIERYGRRLPRNQDDARWVLEDRRYVEITTDKKWEKQLFEPLVKTYISKQDSALLFNSNIIGFVPLLKGSIKLQSGELRDSLSIQNELTINSLNKKIAWQLDSNSHHEWLQKRAEYSLTLTDTLSREFLVRPKETFLNMEISGNIRRYYILANFNKTTPYYSFYYPDLVKIIPSLLKNPKTRVHFHGHGCATGTEWINNKLSKQRADTLQLNFLKYLSKIDTNLYNDVNERLDTPCGFGEYLPLQIIDNEGKVATLGNNNTPLGRILNRRIIVYFYDTPIFKIDCDRIDQVDEEFISKIRKRDFF